MANIHRTVALGASADEIWARLEAPDRINEWLTFLGPVTWDPATSTRTCSLGEAELGELVLSIDPERRRFAYSIVDSPMGLQHHSASMEVVERDGGATLVWDHDFLPDSAAPMLTEAVEGAVAVITAADPVSN
ncbi:MAG: SRPBCC family protein [Acidimicrobiales bacterium]